MRQQSTRAACCIPTRTTGKEFFLRKTSLFDISHVVPGAELGCQAFPRQGELAGGRAAGNCSALLRGIVPQPDKGVTKQKTLPL